MDEVRQKIQEPLALTRQPTGEARRWPRQGTERSMTGRAAESLVDEQLMERVCERENLKGALAQVKRNKGSAGVDGMSVEQLPGYLKAHWLDIRERLLAGQ